MADDLISFASKRGLLDEAGARAAIGGGAPKAEDLVSKGFLNSEDLAGLLRDYHESIRQAPRPSVCCGTCGRPMAHDGDAIVCAGCGLRLVAEPKKLADELPAIVAEAAADPKNQFGPYVLMRKLGEGGFGVVMLAYDRKLRRTVAIKIIQSTDEEELQRFQREAQVAASLRHPNIAAVYDVGQAQGKTYLAMEFVEGRTLGSREEPLGKTLAAVRDVARAIHYAHTKGIVHRDLKPGNVMVDAAGRAFVLDFGLARRIEGHSITVTGTIMGTPAFMSPEQAGGNPVDARSDIYSIGAMLYMLTTRLPPFSGGAAQVLSMVMHDEPTAPRRIAPGIPVDVEVIIQKAMAKEKERRYATAEALADDLDRFLRGEAIVARPATISYRLKKRVRRNPWAWAMSAAFVVAVIVGAAFGARQVYRSWVETSRRLEALHLKEVIERAGRQVRDLETVLARRNPDARLASAYAELDALIAELRGEAERSPEEPALWIARGEAQILRNREEAAVDDFTRALDAGGGAAAAFGRARARLRIIADYMVTTEGWEVQLQRQRQRAMKELTLVERDVEAAEAGGLPDDARRVLELWTLYFKGVRGARGEWRALVQAAGEEIARGGRIEEFFFLRGLVQPPEEAAKSFESSLFLNHGRPRVWLHLGIARVRSDPKRAIEAYDEALRLRPDYAWALVNRGATRHGEGDRSGAREDFEKAVAADPAFPLAYLNRGDVRRDDGDLDGAVEDYERAMKLDTQIGSAYQRRGQILQRRKRYDEAIVDFGRAIERGPDVAEFRYDRGWANYERGAIAASLPDFDAAIERNPNVPRYYNDRGVARRLTENAEGAIEDFTAALALDGERAEALLNRGDTYRELGDVERAMKDFKRFLEVAPGHAMAPEIRAKIEELSKSADF